MRLPIAALLLTLAAAPHALAQSDSRDLISLQDQIAELRQEIQILQQNQQNAGVAQYTPPAPQPQAAPAPTNDTAAELTVRVSALEEQNRVLQGRVDDLANQLQKQTDLLNKQISDLAFKLGQGNAPTAAPPAESAQEAPPAESPPAEAAKPFPKMPAEEALKEGKAAIARRDYATAAAAAHQILSAKKPTHQSEAYLLQARAEGGLHQYHEAAADYMQSYKANPQSPDAPVALLGMAYAFIGEKKNKDACKILTLLNQSFPHPSAIVKTNEAAARKTAACPK